jgi:zinc transport system ATP-binding protein
VPLEGDEVLRCEKLVIGYGKRALLPAFDLSIKKGQFTLVVGRNGAGKSSWLKTVLGIIPPVSGRVIRGAPIARAAYVPQAAGLDAILPIRARDVVSWGRLRGWGFLNPFSSRDDSVAVKNALANADASAFAREPFRELSGGQRQRVLFARMLASDAELALLDEPTASMDNVSERDAYQRLAGLAHEDGMAIVVVTHTLSVAKDYADHVLFFDRGDKDRGVVISGTVAEVLNQPVFRRHFGRMMTNDE